MFFACPIVRSQEKAAPVPKSSFTIDLWEKGLPNSNGMEAQGYDDAKYNFKAVYHGISSQDNPTCFSDTVLPGHHHEQRRNPHWFAPEFAGRKSHGGDGKVV